MKIMASVGIMGIFLATSCFAQTALKNAFKNDFLIGAALNEAEFTGRDTNSATIVMAQFDSISPENALKWESIHPRRFGFNFGPADAYVAFGRKNKMFIVGHTLVWHNQTPKWVFQDGQGNPLARDALLRTDERPHFHRCRCRYREKSADGTW